MAKLDERTIAMIKAIYARRNTYFFIDTKLDLEDEYYEFAVSAESLKEAWEYLDNDTKRYEFVCEE